ncbi:MAG: ribonuclease D [Pseudomonadales bacterium]
MADTNAAAPIWIDSNAGLAEAVRSFGEVIAVDTEFIRTDTFFPIPGLYQIGTESEVFLVDPLAVDDWVPLQAVIEDPNCIKVMHSCSEDLEVFHSHLGLAPQSLFDSQLAHAFLTTDFSMSYARLVAHYCDIELDKGETRSNWLQRPLTDRQIHYAAEDVRYLVGIYQTQRAALEECGRLEWFFEDLAVQCRYQPPYPERYYLNMKAAWRLDSEALARLRDLSRWREQEAMSRNLPRNRVVRDEHLLTLAESRNLTRDAIFDVLPGGVARRFADALRSAWAGETSVEEPIETPPQPLTQSQGKVVNALRDIGKNQAANLGVAPELLARKRDVEAALRSHLDGTGLARFDSGWRAGLLREAFIDLLAARA